MSIPAEGVPFALKNSSSGLYLGIAANATYAGAEAVLITATNGSLPQWYLQKEQNAHYLINSSVPNMCLNVAYERTTAGGNLQQWTCNGGASELWALMPTTNGRFALVNKNSGLAIGATELREGSPVTQMESASHASALWEVTKEPGTYTPTAATLADEMIYNIYAPIFSKAGTLNAITQDLPRIASMGFSTLLIMPIHPIGVPTGSHPAVESPYAVADYYAVAPSLGSLHDFASLVTQAHRLGFKLIMDVVLNHTAWNHPFITQHPEYYVHKRQLLFSRKKSPDAIAHAFWFEDVAQLDFKSGTTVQEYMSAMLVWWVKNYNVDGFRFDTADNPYGDDRMIPASAWAFIGKNLQAVNPKIILLGECTNPALSLRPFNMDYNNHSLQPAIALAARSQNASGLPNAFEVLKAAHPAGMLHTSIMQTWDMDLDLRMYGGPDGTLAAAVFNFTIEGVPMLFAGEEAGNDRGGVNTHELINWDGPLAKRFRNFYSSLVMLRRRSGALRRGNTKWLSISPGSPGLIAFARTGESDQCIVAINFSASAIRGSINELPSGKWIEVTPPGAALPGAHHHPSLVYLGPWDFLVFARDLRPA